MQKILVVDDMEINRELLREILEEDYIVETTEDGEKALTVLRQRHNETAALLLDLRMPNKDGFAVLEEMRENGWINKIPVLIISGEHAVEVENQCFELGVSDFIHKPFEVSIVKNRVRNAIELSASKKRLQAK